METTISSRQRPSLPPWFSACYTSSNPARPPGFWSAGDLPMSVHRTFATWVLGLALLGAPSARAAQEPPAKEPGASSLEVPLAKGTTFLHTMTSTVEAGGTTITTTTASETTITAISETSVTYDQHTTGKTLQGASSVDLPPQDRKNQSFRRARAGVSAPSLPGGAKPEETDLDVKTPVFTGKVHVIHLKSEFAESWASKEPFEAVLRLPGDRRIKATCTFVRTASVRGDPADTQVLNLAEFPIVTLFMHSQTKGEFASETTILLREIR